MSHTLFRIFLAVFLVIGFPLLSKGQNPDFIGPIAGLSRSTQFVDFSIDEDFDSHYRSGFSGGFYSQWLLKRSSIILEVLFTQRGMRQLLIAGGDIVPDLSQTEKYWRVDYLSVSCLFKKPFVNNIITPYWLIGPRLYRVLGQKTPTWTSSYFSQIYRNVRGVEFGLDIGLGIGSGSMNDGTSIFLELRYNIHLTRAYFQDDILVFSRNADDDYQPITQSIGIDNKSIQLLFGYSFSTLRKIR